MTNIQYSDSQMQRENVTIVQQIKQLISKKQEARQLRALIRCVEQMFDYSYIFKNRSFRQVINKNRKGYIPFSIIFQQQKFTQCLRQNGLSQISPEQEDIMSILMHLQIKSHSQILWSYPGGARRMDFGSPQFIGVYFEGIPFSKEGKQTFEAVLYSRCNIIDIIYDKLQEWAIVYTDNQAALLELNDCELSFVENNQNEQNQVKCKLKVLQPQEAERIEENNKKYVGQTKFDLLYISKSEIQYPCLSRIQVGYDADIDVHQTLNISKGEQDSD